METLSSHVLIIDPDQITQRIMGRILHDRGYEVSVASTAEEGLELWNNKPARLVILDQMLKGMSGTEFCYLLRKRPGAENVHILVSTTKTRSQDLRAILAAGADDYIAKPYEPEILEVRLMVAEAQLDQLEARKQLEKDLEFLARHDPLTELGNRSALMPAIREAQFISRKGLSCFLLYLDLDNFKVINDTVGHSAGDKLLVRVAQMLRDLAQSEVGLVRFGGDEFVLVLQGCDEAAALNLANELREKLEHLVFHEEGVAFRVSGSIGLAEVLHQVSPEEVLSRADSACYGAKAKGRNQVEMYHPDNTALAQLSSDTNWSLVIRNAIKQGHLRLWYQPVIQLKDNEVLYHEALLRYRDPQMLTVTNAGIFLPSVERAGNIQAVDQYVLEQAFAFLKSGKVGRLGINLSIQTLAQRELIERVEKLAETHQVRPQDVVFEITETAAVSNLDRVGDTMKALQAQGYQFALDDFGSGFASLTHLERLPVNVLKIDRGLLKNVVQDPFEQAIVKALVEVARVQGLTTVAEGVEDETTLRALKDLGLDCAQGYFIGRPTSLE